MSTVSPDSKRDKIRQVETFPQPRNAKRQLPKPSAHGSPLPSARERGGWPRRGWKRKAVIKPPFPQLNHPSLGTCTPLVPFHSRRNLCYLLPADRRDPKLHAAAPRVEVLGMLSLPGVHLSLPQTAQGSRVRQVWHKSPRLITTVNKPERTELQRATGLMCSTGAQPRCYTNPAPWLWHNFCQHSPSSLILEIPRQPATPYFAYLQTFIPSP